MKVSELKEVLDKSPDDEDVFALLYTKDMFDFPDEDELLLTHAAWAELVAELEQVPFNDLWESVMDGVLDVAVMREENAD